VHDTAYDPGHAHHHLGATGPDHVPHVAAPLDGLGGRDGGVR
jgi:hypothetical protein